MCSTGSKISSKLASRREQVPRIFQADERASLELWLPLQQVDLVVIQHNSSSSNTTKWPINRHRVRGAPRWIVVCLCASSSKQASQSSKHNSLTVCPCSRLTDRCYSSSSSNRMAHRRLVANTCSCLTSSSPSLASLSPELTRQRPPYETPSLPWP